MLIVLDVEHKEDLKIIGSIPAEFLEEFCKLAIRFLNEGENKKFLAKASQALSIAVNDLERFVKALSHLFSECSKFKLNDLDFVDSMKLIFPENIIKVLRGFYFEHCEALRRGVLTLRETRPPSLRFFNWRLDIEVASRSMQHSLMPVYMLEFHVQRRKELARVFCECDVPTLKKMLAELTSALKDSRSQHYRRFLRSVK